MSKALNTKPLIFSYLAVQVPMVPLKSLPNTLFHGNKANLIDNTD